MTTTPHYTDHAGAVTLWYGDCRQVLAELPDASMDSVVTDPPYELGFMGRKWDASGVAYDTGMWAEVLRVLKPGGHLLAFGGTRTWHRMVCAIEDAGFEIRDSLQWLYGSGFPKSLDVSKAIDKRPGVARHAEFAAHLAARRLSVGLSRADVSQSVVGSRSGACWNWEHHQFPEARWWPALKNLLGLDQKWDAVIAEADRAVTGVMSTSRLAVAPGQGADRSRVDLDITAPATPDAERWQGWGTALKPAVEPICLARKPLVGTVAGNVLEWGTGALNIDGCRVAGEPWTPVAPNGGGRSGGVMGNPSQHPGGEPHAAGRWPANVLLDEDAAALLDQQSGESASRIGKPRGAASGDGWGMTATGAEYSDSGGASRFFYVAKAPQHERPRLEDGTAHPTVKPVALMRWLVRLITPPGGTVLDPFAGTGTTAEAALVEGFRCVLIEAEADHLPLIVQRLSKPIQPTLIP